MPTHIEGLRQAVKQLEQFGVEVGDLKDVMSAIATKATEVMRPFIPSRTGKLRGSARGNRAKGKAVVSIGTARIRYGPVINYGWAARHIRPANFTRKTDEVMEDLAPQMLAEGIDQLIEKRGLN